MLSADLVRAERAPVLTPPRFAAHGATPPDGDLRALAAYAQLLWSNAPHPRRRPAATPSGATGGATDVAVPWVDGHDLWLPPSTEDGITRDRPRDFASVAHAAAHGAYSRAIRYDAGALPPLTRVLIGLLEDARVESLAIRELPGLKALWLSRHRAPVHDVADVPSLLARLARSLLALEYDDTHPWIAKARRLCFSDRAPWVLHLRDADDLRRIASMLAHDLGQMRWAIDLRDWRPPADYRDDNRWLWTPDTVAVQMDGAGTAPAAAEHAPAPAAVGEHDVGVAAAGNMPQAHSLPVADGAAVQRHAEWDYRIGIARPAWVAVHTSAAPMAPTRHAGSPPDRTAVHRWHQLDVQRMAARQARQRSDWGETLADDTPLDWAALRHGAPMRIERPYAQPGRQPATPGTVCLLLDRSASAADPIAPRAGWPRNGLHTAPTPPPAAISAWDCTRRVAATLATAWQGRHQLHVRAFNSRGRHAVHVVDVLAAGEPWTDATAAQLQRLEPAWSTRLGAVLRDATEGLRSTAAPAPRHLLLMGDGVPHDIDSPDPRYLREDARQAVLEARRRGIVVICLSPTAHGAAVRDRVFGRQGHVTISADGRWIDRLHAAWHAAPR